MTLMRSLSSRSLKEFCCSMPSRVHSGMDSIIVTSRSSDLRAGEVDHDHGRRVAFGQRTKLRLKGRGLQLRLQPFEKRTPVDLPGGVQGETEILGERTLARAVKARHPNADLVASSSESFIETIQQAVEAPGDIVGGDILGEVTS